MCQGHVYSAHVQKLTGKLGLQGGYDCKGIWVAGLHKAVLTPQVVLRTEHFFGH